MADLLHDISNPDPRIIEVDPACVKVSRWNPRIQVANDEDQQRELIASVEAHGQLQPALITATDDGFELIAGTRRLAAARHLGCKLKAIVVECKSELAAFALAHAENNGRQAVSHWEFAASLAQARASGLFSNEKELAAAVGKDKSTVNRALALADAPPIILRLFRDKREITARQSATLLPMLNDDDKRRRIMARAVALSNEPPASADSVFQALLEAASNTAEPLVERLKNEHGRLLATMRLDANGRIAVNVPPMKDLHVSHRRQAVRAISDELRRIVDTAYPAGSR